MTVERERRSALEVFAAGYLGYYRLYRTLSPEQETSIIDVPIRIQIDWDRLAHLVRQ